MDAPKVRRNPFAPQRCDTCKTTSGSVTFVCVRCAITKCKHFMDTTSPSRTGVCTECADKEGR